jgi:predicted nucleic acid-binding protein
MANAVHASGASGAGQAIVFVDTHVLLCADDAFDGARQAQARAWLQALWKGRVGRVSTQVLSDYYVAATRKFGMPAGDARAKLRRFQLWQPWQIDHQTVETAWGVEARFGLPYWDALMVACGAQAGATHVLTPTLEHLLHVDGVTILNPFLSTPADLGLTG